MAAIRNNPPNPATLASHKDLENHKRREALPWQQPKATEEEPEASRRVQAILHSPSYRHADKVGDFLARDGVRRVRLQIDCLNPANGPRSLMRTTNERLFR